MARPIEKIQAEINLLESRVKAAIEFLKDMEQQAKVQGTSVAENPDCAKIIKQIPLVKDRLRSLYAELESGKATVAQTAAAPPKEEKPPAETPPKAEKPITPPPAPPPPKEEEPPPAPAVKKEPFITTTPVGTAEAYGATSTIGATPESLTKRGFSLLEDGEWEKAGDKFDSALDINSEYAPAYVGLLCAELKVTREANLANQNSLLSARANYKKALRYSTAEHRVRLETYNHIIEHRLEEQEDSQEQERRKQEQQRLNQERERLNQEQERLNQEKEKLLQTQKLEQEQILAELRRREQEEEDKRMQEEEKRTLDEERSQQAELRRAEKQKQDEEEQRLIEEEQEFRKNQKTWIKKGLCYYCGGKLTITKKCKSCGKTS
ncbi:MAG: hypothetical protein LBC82_03000 [Oscillospiraceae bacterium]|jgi:tetratricopeptide (TPR) repeat protein|nr:hypothetical protein [Oscillospiraceae bacterium]